MSATEEQPLLDNTNAGVGMGKGLSWDAAGKELHVDSLHNGLQRRDKNGEHNGSLDGCVRINLPPPEREEPRYPPEKLKTLFAFIFLVLCMVWTLMVLAVVHDRMPNRNTTLPLNDVFFDVFPQVDRALEVAEVIIMVSLWLCILMIFMHKHRFIVLRRCFIIIGLLYFMRCVTFFVTQVPVANTDYYCAPQANTSNPIIIVKRVFSMLTGFGMSINGKHKYCGDYIFSGHTCILTICYLVIKEYSPRRFWPMHWIMWISSSIGVFLILLSRGHYTVDVVLAYYITTRFFWMYHTLANNAAFKVPGTYNYLSRVWWFSIFHYFEKNVGGVVPRQYEWPLPWPRRFSKHTRIS